MLRTVKLIFSLLIVGLASQRASAFSMFGLPYSWQTADMNYGAVEEPRNLGEEYRLNTPIITYGFDSSFLDYFGVEGVKAVDEAFKLMNSLPAVSKLSPDLSEYLMEGSKRINQRAQALYVMDVKSIMLSALVDHLGLAGESHVFDLRNRTTTPTTCVFDYMTIVRNFDPITWNPSHYVNGTLYTFQIVDSCPAPNVGDALEEIVDPAAVPYSAVASIENWQMGMYYLSLTRDDMGGLRYLYRKDNYNNEYMPIDAVADPISNGSAFNVPVAGSGGFALGGVPVTSSPWGVPFTGTNGGATPVTGGTIGGQAVAVGGNTNAALRGGIEKITFVKMRYDSLLGTGFVPVTLKYTVPALKNYKLSNQRVSRVVLSPDILISAADLDQGGVFITRSYVGEAPPQTGGFSGVVGGTGGTVVDVTPQGPGVFDPRMTVYFNKVGPFWDIVGAANVFFLGQGSGGLREANSQQGFVWGHFDGTTNDPVVFPSGSSIRDMERQVFTDPGQPVVIGQ